jgi:hypothetical protein
LNNNLIADPINWMKMQEPFKVMASANWFEIQVLSESFSMSIRVARWDIFEPKIPIWVNFVGH